MISKFLIPLVVAAGLAAQNQSAPQPASTPSEPFTRLNQALPSWVRFNAQYRNRVERAGGIGYRAAQDAYDLNQLRILMKLQPLWWLGFSVETQDSEIMFNQRIASAPPYDNAWDFRQAYVELGSSKRGWFHFIAGRQALTFGDERVIGPSNWLNMGRTFDALRVSLRRGGYKLSLFASSVVVARDGAIDHHIQGNNLHGAYGSLENLIPHSTLEPYVLWRLAPGNVRLNENQGRGALNEVTVGFLWKGRFGPGFDYDIEIDRQTGSLGPSSIRAWAGHWNVGRTFAAARVRPFIEANYASGTQDRAGGVWGTFDQIYPSSHNKMDFADQVGRRNIEQIRPGVEKSFGRKWKISATWEDLWLASARDGLYNSGGALAALSPTGAAGRRVGHEFDIWAEWSYRTAVDIGFGYAQLFAGAFLRQTTPGKDFTYPFAYLTYHFASAPEP